MLKKTKVNSITNLKKTDVKKVVVTPQPGFSYDDNTERYKTFKELISGEDLNLDNLDSENISYTDENRTYDFCFRLGEVGYCCALTTIGAFECSANFPEDKLTEIIDGLIEIDDEVIMFTTNGVNSSIPLEKALLKSKYFKLVRTLKSTDKKRNIKMYVSNNDNN